MTEHDKISSDVEATASSEQVAVPSQGRRRLVKGTVFAAPVVMTLFNGRLAAATSICACRDKLPLVDDLNKLVAARDNYIREEVILTVCDNGYYFDGADYYTLNGNVYSSASPNPNPSCTDSTVTAYKLKSYNGHAMTPSCLTSIAGQCP